MERWEKEYLEAIGRDGHESNEKSNSATAKKKPAWVKIIVSLILLSVLFFAFRQISQLKQETSLNNGVDISARGSSSFVSVDPNQTYIDGRQFKHMMELLSEITTIQSEILNEGNASGFSFSETTIDLYLQRLEDWVADFKVSKTHKSYEVVCQNLVDTEAVLESFLKQLYSGPNPATINAYGAKINELNAQREEALLSALDANGISYSVGENGAISYQSNDY